MTEISRVSIHTDADGAISVLYADSTVEAGIGITSCLRRIFAKLTREAICTGAGSYSSRVFAAKSTVKTGVRRALARPWPVGHLARGPTESLGAGTTHRVVGHTGIADGRAVHAQKSRFTRGTIRTIRIPAVATEIIQRAYSSDAGRYIADIRGLTSESS